MTLRPASLDRLNLELLACLRLNAPVGMTDDERLEWLKVARDTVKHLPEDLLAAGCVEARRKADHHRQIVPIIMQTVEGAMKARRDIHRSVPIRPERQIEVQRPTAKQIAEILRSTGFQDAATKVEKGERLC